MKKNDVFTVTITDMDEEGAGIGKLDGYTWFIKDTVIGDEVEAGAMKMKKTYGFARLIRVITPSSARTEPKCPVARQCGGCQFQAMAYDKQLLFKENKIKNALQRIGGVKNVETLMEPILGMEHPWRYRNKAQFPIGLDKNGKIVAGFYAGHTHCIIPQEDCLLGVEENPKILEIVRKFMEEYRIRPYDEDTHTGLVRHVLIRKGFHTGEIMVCLVINGKKLPAAEKLLEALLTVPGMTSISINRNQEKTNVIMGQEIVHLYGNGYITDWIGDVKYQISPLSFYQVNPVQTEKLYATALEYAGLTGNEVVWDLYCGIGTISLFLAKKAKMVYGVEIVPQAIADANANARLNGMENTEFFVGKAEEVLPEQFEKHQIYADVIVVDPPRKGCDEKCLETMVKMQPEKIVYVSCNPATLGRDVKYLTDAGYEVKRVRGCDMFAWGGHVETVALLVKKR
ncbi:MAG: 23S rRNA (uracil(1939)-C(5))-methyltransferase RlmD [bacterium]|nr:23S rRNA (uracil(1939)-C(5))-methyltransferase RlmD [bacterium]